MAQALDESESPEFSTPPNPESAPSNGDPKSGRSTGPRTSAGKARSSMNRLSHGCCSEKTILPHEDPAEYEHLLNKWRAHYAPRSSNKDFNANSGPNSIDDFAETTLVDELAHAHWFLKRARARLEDIEVHLPANAWHWTDSHQKLFTNFSRYKTAAERAFFRLFKDIESRRARLTAAQIDREKALAKAAAIEFEWLKGKVPTGKLKELAPAQVAEIGVVDGETVTDLYPSNQELYDSKQESPETPCLVRRFLVFSNGIPPEYEWARPALYESPADGTPMAIQKVLWKHWPDLIERESADPSGHILPSLVNPPPKT